MVINHLLPSKLTYPTKREKENHRLKSGIFGGYVSSLEGRWDDPPSSKLVYIPI